jgi:hypothetical protein
MKTSKAVMPAARLSRAPNALLGAAILLALAACAAGPDYAGPASTMPEAFHHAGPAAASEPLVLDA